MSTAARLLARKQQLMERLHDEAPGPHERDEIERLLAQIDAALNLLDGSPPDSDAE
jgi:ribosomal protein S24E